MRAARGALVGVGCALLVVGAVFEVTLAPPAQVPGVLLWLAAAIVLHDAVLSPAVLVAALVSRRAGRRLPAAALAAVQAAAVVGGVLALLALPAIAAKRQGTANPSVLPFDYGASLVLVWAVLLVATTAFVIVVSRAGRGPAPRRPRRGARP